MPSRLNQREMANLCVIVIAAGGLLAAGCAAQREAPSLTASDPQAQNAWIATAVKQNDWTAVPGLIELLDSSDPAERLVAIGALRSITNESHGYRIADPVAIRGQAIDRWVAWWNEKDGSGNASSPLVGADTGS